MNRYSDLKKQTVIKMELSLTQAYQKLFINKNIYFIFYLIIFIYILKYHMVFIESHQNIWTKLLQLSICYYWILRLVSSLSLQPLYNKLKLVSFPSYLNNLLWLIVLVKVSIDLITRYLVLRLWLNTHNIFKILFFWVLN